MGSVSAVASHDGLSSHRASDGLAPRNAQAPDHANISLSGRFGAEASAVRKSGGGACYAYCPPGMGFGVCFDMPAGTPKGNCSSVTNLAGAVCPSHGNPRLLTLTVVWDRG